MHRRSRLGAAFFTLVLLACNRTEVVPGFPDSFAGVGLELRIEGNHPVVVRTLPGGPAEIAGVQPGDQVLHIDGFSTAGASLGEVVVRLRGKPDSQVSMTVNRNNELITLIMRRQLMKKDNREGDYTPSPQASGAP